MATYPPYRELFCQLCGVSFGMARIRRPDEPFEAAWDTQGHDFCYKPSRAGEDPCDACGPQAPSRCPSQSRVAYHGGLEVEHLAGPNCRSTHAYSGQRISLEEMKGCRSVQCLVRKRPWWKPEGDDQEFEGKANVFLTGIGDSPFDTEPFENFQPVRHGVEVVQVTHAPWGLLEGTWAEVHDEFPRDLEVKSAYSSGWTHYPGTEWLVANPIQIPGLSAMLASCPPNVEMVNSSSSGYGTAGGGSEETKSADDLTPSAAAAPSTTSGPFPHIPVELVHMIVRCCPPEDIIHLGRVSRAFREMISMLIRGLVLQDLPWLWEAHDLPVEEANWWCLYQLAFNFKLKGLRNRKRIWGEVSEIVRRIGKSRAEGALERFERNRDEW
ncbi:MAG: hypothetical protein M1823_005563 [Watsoniomyces obsoletus]|nr:MAG: hypothetical protein M1823_005563 [Watsoniomyces obsoletus]